VRQTAKTGRDVEEALVDGRLGRNLVEAARIDRSAGWAEPAGEQLEVFGPVDRDLGLCARFGQLGGLIEAFDLITQLWMDLAAIEVELALDQTKLVNAEVVDRAKHFTAEKIDVMAQVTEGALDVNKTSLQLEGSWEKCGGDMLRMIASQLGREVAVDGLFDTKVDKRDGAFLHNGFDAGTLTSIGLEILAANRNHEAVIYRIHQKLDLRVMVIGGTIS
jgi:hypothetical protein